MLHLIRRGQSAAVESASKSEGQAQGSARCQTAGEGRGSSLRRRLLGRCVLGGLLLGLIPAPLPFLPPSLAPGLQAQVLPERYRRFSGPPVPPNQAARNPSARTAQAPPAPPAKTSPPMPDAPPASPAAAAPAALPPSLLDQPAQPAQIELSGKTLSIHADNSSLGAILREISSKSGMELQGFRADERVFGTFGPAAPRAVLSDLLNGTPYDLVMVGDLSNGAPRQLILSPATPGGPTPPSPQESAQNEQQYVPPPQPPEPGQRREIAPGVNPQIVRTPQQMLQELQRMRQQQGQQ